MTRSLIGLTLVVGLSACGESPTPNSKDLLIGTWLHDSDAAHLEIPSSVTYRDDGTMTVVGEPTSMPSETEPPTKQGRWIIDDHNRIDMSVVCVGSPLCVPDPLGGAIVDFRVSTRSLTWIYGDQTEWHFHK